MFFGTIIVPPPRWVRPVDNGEGGELGELDVVCGPVLFLCGLGPAGIYIILVFPLRGF